MSEVVENLRAVRGVAWAALIPAIDHAIMRAEEAEFVAAEAANLAQCSVEPAYPPLVLKLAAARGGAEPESEAPELFPGTLAAVDSLSIRDHVRRMEDLTDSEAEKSAAALGGGE